MAPRWILGLIALAAFVTCLVFGLSFRGFYADGSFFVFRICQGNLDKYFDFSNSRCFAYTLQFFVPRIVAIYTYDTRIVAFVHSIISVFIPVALWVWAVFLSKKETLLCVMVVFLFGLVFWGLDVARLAVENTAPVMVVDLDNTITVDEPGVPYNLKKPNLAVIEKMKEFSRAGWEIVIFTSRRMDSFGSDEARLLADVGATTLKWLEEHSVPFNGIRFGKPYARHGYYVDDKALRPDEFLAMSPGVGCGIKS